MELVVSVLSNEVTKKNRFSKELFFLYNSHSHSLINVVGFAVGKLDGFSSISVCLPVFLM